MRPHIRLRSIALFASIYCYCYYAITIISQSSIHLVDASSSSLPYLSSLPPDVASSLLPSLSSLSSPSSSSNNQSDSDDAFDQLQSTLNSALQMSRQMRDGIDVLRRRHPINESDTTTALAACQSSLALLTSQSASSPSAIDTGAEYAMIQSQLNMRDDELSSLRLQIAQQQSTIDELRATIKSQMTTESEEVAEETVAEAAGETAEGETAGDAEEPVSVEGDDASATTSTIISVMAESTDNDDVESANDRIAEDDVDGVAAPEADADASEAELFAAFDEILTGELVAAAVASEALDAAAQSSSSPKSVPVFGLADASASASVAEKTSIMSALASLLADALKLKTKPFALSAASVAALSVDDASKSADDVDEKSKDEKEDEAKAPVSLFQHSLPLHQQSSLGSSISSLSAPPAAPFPAAYVRGSFSSSSDPDLSIAEKQQAVRLEYAHAYAGYKEHAWGFDELHPVSREGRNSQYLSAATMVDALDGLILMGFEDEYREVRDYLQKYMRFDEQEDINLFETSIRVLGGLLSAYALTTDQLFLELATQCADGLLLAFDTPTGIPRGTVGLKSKQAYNPAWCGQASTMSEVGSIQLEWQFLSRASGNPLYAAKVDRVTRAIASLSRTLYPQFISPSSGEVTNAIVTFGARVDSLYEYFLKQHLLNPFDHGAELPSQNPDAEVAAKEDEAAAVRAEERRIKASASPKDRRPIDMYADSMHAMNASLIRTTRAFRSTPASSSSSDSENEQTEGFTYIAENHGLGPLVGKMDHLVCFVPGMLALGAQSQSAVPDEALAQAQVELARKLMRTCYAMYSMTETGLAAEIYQFVDSANSTAADGNGMSVDVNSAHSLLRPEAVESLFIMHRVTHDPIYRQWGWTIFTAIRKYARVESGGYSGLKDVRTSNRPEDKNTKWTNWNDKMESFFLSETLKYLYLLFSPDDLLPLDEWVFNTEAHPFPIQTAPLPVAVDALANNDNVTSTTNADTTTTEATTMTVAETTTIVPDTKAEITAAIDIAATASEPSVDSNFGVRPDAVKSELVDAPATTDVDASATTINIESSILSDSIVNVDASSTIDDHSSIIAPATSSSSSDTDAPVVDRTTIASIQPIVDTTIIGTPIVDALINDASTVIAIDDAMLPIAVIDLLSSHTDIGTIPALASIIVDDTIINAADLASLSHPIIAPIVVDDSPASVVIDASNPSPSIYASNADTNDALSLFDVASTPSPSPSPEVSDMIDVTHQYHPSSPSSTLSSSPSSSSPSSSSSSFVTDDSSSLPIVTNDIATIANDVAPTQQ